MKNVMFAAEHNQHITKNVAFCTMNFVTCAHNESIPMRRPKT